MNCRSRGSSVSIVSDYGLDDQAIGVRSPAGAKDLSSILYVQTGSGAHPASCPMGTGGKARPGRDADHWPPSSAEVVNEYELYHLSPQAPTWRVAGLLYHELCCCCQLVCCLYSRSYVIKIVIVGGSDSLKLYRISRRRPTIFKLSIGAQHVAIVGLISPIGIKSVNCCTLQRDIPMWILFRVILLDNKTWTSLFTFTLQGIRNSVIPWNWSCVWSPRGLLPLHDHVLNPYCRLSTTELSSWN
jgi:hypothetical protein